MPDYNQNKPDFVYYTKNIPHQTLLAIQTIGNRLLGPNNDLILITEPRSQSALNT